MALHPLLQMVKAQKHSLESVKSPRLKSIAIKCISSEPCINVLKDPCINVGIHMWNPA